jgi:hypothetical protein
MSRNTRCTNRGSTPKPAPPRTSEIRACSPLARIAGARSEKARVSHCASGRRPSATLRPRARRQSGRRPIRHAPAVPSE